MVWCHTGVGWEDEVTRAGWEFLRPHLAAAEAYVFSRRDYVPSWISADKVWIIPPSIDPFSPKNQPLAADTVRAILVKLGVLDGAAPMAPATFVRRDGGAGTVTRPAAVIGEGRPGPGDPVLVQVSRWDRLKDPLGVLGGFAHTGGIDDAHLLLAGPTPAAVADDPEAEQVLTEVRDAWDGLGRGIRERVHLASLPAEDVEENAVIVNALQRRADIVVQKSLAEGFGLTVTEAMWKARPVVAGRVGGIRDQIDDGANGLLVDPRDTAAFEVAVGSLLRDPERARGLAIAARERVRERYLPPQYLGGYLELIERLLP